MGWSGELPEPVLAGTKATYPEVLPSIDLAVEATRTGFEQFVVVKSPGRRRQVSPALAADHRQVARLAEPGRLRRPRPSGAKGRVVATSPTPLTWDAKICPTARRPAGAPRCGPSGQAKRKAAARVEGDAGRRRHRADPRPRVDRGPGDDVPGHHRPALAVGGAFDTYVNDGDTGDQGGVNNLQSACSAGPAASAPGRSSPGTRRRCGASRSPPPPPRTTTSTRPPAPRTRGRSGRRRRRRRHTVGQPARLAGQGSGDHHHQGLQHELRRQLGRHHGHLVLPACRDRERDQGYMGIRATTRPATSCVQAVPVAQRRRQRAGAQSHRSPTTRTRCSGPGRRPGDRLCHRHRPAVHRLEDAALKAKSPDTEGTAMNATFEWSPAAGAGNTTVTTVKARFRRDLRDDRPGDAFAENG